MAMGEQSLSLESSLLEHIFSLAFEICDCRNEKGATDHRGHIWKRGQETFYCVSITLNSLAVSSSSSSSIIPNSEVRLHHRSVLKTR